MGEPKQPTPHEPSTAAVPVSRSQRAPLIISIITLLLVLGLIGFDVWKYTQPNWDGLADDVQTSMNQFLSTDAQLARSYAHVTSLTVMHATDNVFEGQATVASSGGTEREIPVHIIWNGESMLWRTDSGAFAYLMLGT